VVAFGLVVVVCGVVVAVVVPPLWSSGGGVTDVPGPAPSVVVEVIPSMVVEVPFSDAANEAAASIPGTSVTSPRTDPTADAASTTDTRVAPIQAAIASPLGNMTPFSMTGERYVIRLD
jgi:hypothetical protein